MPFHPNYAIVYSKPDSLREGLDLNPPEPSQA